MLLFSQIAVIESLQQAKDRTIGEPLISLLPFVVLSFVNPHLLGKAAFRCLAFNFLFQFLPCLCVSCSSKAAFRSHTFAFSNTTMNVVVHGVLSICKVEVRYKISIEKQGSYSRDPFVYKDLYSGRFIAYRSPHIGF